VVGGCGVTSVEESSCRWELVLAGLGTGGVAEEYVGGAVAASREYWLSGRWVGR